MSIFLMEEQKHLESLRQQVYSCKACYIGQASPCNVFGAGPIDADIVSIAEAPGETEQREGRPLIGKCGVFWTDMLYSVGWDRSQIYICNAVKGRPMYGGKSNTLSPNLEEVDACQHFLHKQISIVQPKMLLVFGKPAAYSLGILTKSDYSKPIKNRLGLQKQPYVYQSWEGKQREALVLLSYHPSYLQNKPDGRAYCFQAYKHLSDAKKMYEADLPWVG